MDIELYIAELAEEAMKSEPELPDRDDSLETVLKGLAVELWSDALGERFWLVADEEDAVKLGVPRGTVYTAAEVRRVIQVGDPLSVAEIHNFKREFDGRVSHYRKTN